MRKPSEDENLSAELEKDERAAVKYGHDINLKDFILRSRQSYSKGRSHRFCLSFWVGILEKAVA